MALTPDEIDAMPEYTAAQELKLAKMARREIMELGQSNAHNGRMKTRADLPALEATISNLEDQVASEAAGGAGLGNITVRIGRR